MRLITIFLFISILISSSLANDVSEEYTIGATDVLKISVWGQEELSGEIPVRPDGKITLPLLGDIQAAGLTPMELSDEISKKLEPYIKTGSQVSVTVLEFNSRKVSILGQVSKPGKYSFAVIPSIMEILTEAGGPLPTADLTAVKVIPQEEDKRVMTVNLDAVLKGEDISSLPKLHSGDSIYVPPKSEPVDKTSSQESESSDTEVKKTEVKQTKESTTEDSQATIKIDVLGQVPRPGQLEFKHKPTIVEALTRAGGVNDSFLLSRVRLIRGDVTKGGMILVDVAKFLETGDYSLLPDLYSGDTIYVPQVNPMDKMEELGFSISGRVTNPGSYTISRPIGLLVALGMAGGLQPDADTEKIKITRETPDTFESKVVDISSLLQKEEPAKSTIVIRPGDTIFVPQKESGFKNVANVVHSVASFLRDIVLVYSAYRLIR